MKKDITEYLDGFKYKFLASEVIQPNLRRGVAYPTFYFWITGKREMPHWLINELKRLTKREIL